MNVYEVGTGRPARGRTVPAHVTIAVLAAGIVDRTPDESRPHWVACKSLLATTVSSNTSIKCDRQACAVFSSPKSN